MNEFTPNCHNWLKTVVAYNQGLTISPTVGFKPPVVTPFLTENIPIGKSFSTIPSMVDSTLAPLIKTDFSTINSAIEFSPSAIAEPNSISPHKVIGIIVLIIGIIWIIKLIHDRFIAYQLEKRRI